jgi:predicted transcriptional regulator
MRVNARLDEESQRQIDYLTETTGMPVSHVLRESVGHYYRQVRAQRAGPKHLVALIGKGESGRSDIASDVKGRLSDALAEKHRAPPLPKSAAAVASRKSAAVSAPRGARRLARK